MWCFLLSFKKMMFLLDKTLKVFVNGLGSGGFLVYFKQYLQSSNFNLYKISII